jgi:hypothetical protein
MKQYLLSVHSVEGAPAPSDEEMQTMFRETDRINDELQAAGAWVFAGGLLSPDSATVVRIENGATTMSDGPFAETKEHIAGFWVIRCADQTDGCCPHPDSSASPVAPSVACHRPGVVT